MQREGLRKGDGSELYFETKHSCTGKRTMGSLARAGSEAESERRRPATGRRPVPSIGQNTVLPAHSGLRPPFITEERIRSDGLGDGAYHDHYPQPRRESRPIHGLMFGQRDWQSRFPRTPSQERLLRALPVRPPDSDGPPHQRMPGRLPSRLPSSLPVAGRAGELGARAYYPSY